MIPKEGTKPRGSPDFLLWGDDHTDGHRSLFFQYSSRKSAKSTLCGSRSSGNHGFPISIGELVPHFTRVDLGTEYPVVDGAFF